MPMLRSCWGRSGPTILATMYGCLKSSTPARRETRREISANVLFLLGAERSGIGPSISQRLLHPFGEGEALHGVPRCRQGCESALRDPGCKGEEGSPVFVCQQVGTHRSEEHTSELQS